VKNTFETSVYSKECTFPILQCYPRIFTCLSQVVPSGFPTKILYIFITSLAPYLSHSILLDLIILTIFSKECYECPHMFSILQLTSSLLGLSVFVCALFSNYLNLQSNPDTAPLYIPLPSHPLPPNLRTEETSYVITKGFPR
jgi:hypothetical protein